MRMVIEIPDCTAKGDGEKRCCYSEPRYGPGCWNGLNGGTYYGQYFDMYDVNRIEKMIAVTTALSDHGIQYSLSAFRRRYRITITAKDYYNMDEGLRARIDEINRR